MPILRIAAAQLRNRVGDLDGNAKRIAEAMEWAEQEAQADVLVLPELVLTGYPLADLEAAPIGHGLREGRPSQR